MRVFQEVFCRHLSLRREVHKMVHHKQHWSRCRAERCSSSHVGCQMMCLDLHRLGDMQEHHCMGQSWLILSAGAVVDVAKGMFNFSLLFHLLVARLMMVIG